MDTWFIANHCNIITRCFRPFFICTCFACILSSIFPMRFFAINFAPFIGHYPSIQVSRYPVHHTQYTGNINVAMLLNHCSKFGIFCVCILFVDSNIAYLLHYKLCTGNWHPWYIYLSNVEELQIRYEWNELTILCESHVCFVVLFFFFFFFFIFVFCCHYKVSKWDKTHEEPRSLCSFRKRTTQKQYQNIFCSKVLIVNR